MNRILSFTSFSFLMFVLVAGIVLAAGFVNQYKMESIGLEELESTATGISDSGWDPVTVSAHMKKKATQKKAGVILKKRKNLQPWETETLPQLESWDETWANDVDRWFVDRTQTRHFEAVGAATDESGDSVPARWTYDGDGPWMAMDLPTFGDGIGEVLAIVVGPGLERDTYLHVGWAHEQGQQTAAVWTERDGASLIDALPNPGGSGASSWANSGVITDEDMVYIAGAMEEGSLRTPVLWSFRSNEDPAQASATPLPLLVGGEEGEATVVVMNAVLVVAGWSYDEPQNQRPVAWFFEGDAWQVQDVGIVAGVDAGIVLGGHADAGESSLVGYSFDLAHKVKKATLWKKKTTFSDWEIVDVSSAVLPDSPLKAEVATGVDALGRIVGYGGLAAPKVEGEHGFALTPDVLTDTDPAPAPPSFTVDVFPNPFNPTVSIHLRSLPAGHAKVTVHDARGRRLTTLHDGSASEGRDLVLRWDGTDVTGRKVGSGVYHIRVSSGNEVASQRVVLAK